MEEYRIPLEGVIINGVKVCDYTDKDFTTLSLPALDGIRYIAMTQKDMDIAALGTQNIIEAEYIRKRRKEIF